MPLYLSVVSLRVFSTACEIPRTRQRRPSHARQRCSARMQHLFGCPSPLLIAILPLFPIVDNTYTLAGLKMHLSTRRWLAGCCSDVCSVLALMVVDTDAGHAFGGQGGMGFVSSARTISRMFPILAVLWGCRCGRVGDGYRKSCRGRVVVQSGSGRGVESAVKADACRMFWERRGKQRQAWARGPR